MFSCSRSLGTFISCVRNVAPSRYSLREEAGKDWRCERLALNGSVKVVRSGILVQSGTAGDQRTQGHESGCVASSTSCLRKRTWMYGRCFRYCRRYNAQRQPKAPSPVTRHRVLMGDQRSACDVSRRSRPPESRSTVDSPETRAPCRQGVSSCPIGRGSSGQRLPQLKEHHLLHSAIPPLWFVTLPPTVSHI